MLTKYIEDSIKIKHINAFVFYVQIFPHEISGMKIQKYFVIAQELSSEIQHGPHCVVSLKTKSFTATAARTSGPTLILFSLKAVTFPSLPASSAVVLHLVRTRTKYKDYTSSSFEVCTKNGDRPSDATTIVTLLNQQLQTCFPFH
jgi:hypothetical protein